MQRAPITVVETPEYLSSVRKMMDENARAELVDHLAVSPETGDLISGTGGLRKLRWALQGRGKRGSARIIYFFYNAGMPLFLLTGYAKNQKADISQADRNDFRRLVKRLIESYGKRKR